MKRFIRYLYEYEEGKRMRNVGFVKVECDYEVCTVHIHGRGLRMGENRKLALYLFYEEDGQCVGIWQGETQNVNPAVNFRLRFTPQDTGRPENFDKIKGVILENMGGSQYAAVWDDMPVNVNHMIRWEPSATEHDTQTPEEIPAEQSQMQEVEQSDSQEMMPEPLELQSESVELETEEAEDMDLVTDVRMKIEEMQMEKAETMRRPYKVSKIQRRDLVKLPRCEWRLSNNSFLLHGYYNYHHLILMEDGNVWRLGVPGIYHEKEEKAAKAFGFTEFIPKEELDVTLAEEEREEEQFGYWCRRIRMQSC
ncbi:MAG: DUF6128 domain-containing protein [Dorea sp.]